MTEYNKIEQIQAIVKELLANLGFDDAKVEYEESITRGLVFNIFCRDAFLLIGREGSTLQSLQSIAQSIAYKKLGAEAYTRFSLDVDDYRIKREWFLKETAREAAAHIKKTGRAVRLEPMAAYERRLVHSYLQEHFPDLRSESEGQEPHRRIVVRKKW